MSSKSIHERKRRSIIKAITYRATATLATFTLAFVFTGSIEIAGQIGVLDFFIKFSIYYLNERLWTKITWGYDKNNKTKENNDYLPESKPIASFEH